MTDPQKKCEKCGKKLRGEAGEVITASNRMYCSIRCVPTPKKCICKGRIVCARHLIEEVGKVRGERVVYGMGDYYALLCKSGVKNDDLIGGVFASREEARECANDVKDCVAKHVIKKCKVTISYKLPAPSKTKKKL